MAVEVFRPLQYDTEVKAGTSVVVLLIAGDTLHVLCSDWRDESVTRIFVTEVLLTGV